MIGGLGKRQEGGNMSDGITELTEGENFAQRTEEGKAEKRRENF